jgi:hypothetical protein
MGKERRKLTMKAIWGVLVLLLVAMCAGTAAALAGLGMDFPNACALW